MWAMELSRAAVPSLYRAPYPSVRVLDRACNKFMLAPVIGVGVPPPPPPVPVPVPVPPMVPLKAVPMFPSHPYKFHISAG